MISKIHRFLKGWWIEVVLLIWFVYIILAWAQLKQELSLDEVKVLALIYLGAEILWDSTALMALWKTSVLQTIYRSRGVIGTLTGLRSVVRLIDPDVPGVKFWLLNNRAIAIIQPTLTIFVAYYILKVPLVAAWGLYLFLLSDLLHTLLTIWRIVVRTNRTFKVVSASVEEHLSGIMEVDQQRYGQTTGAFVTRDTMLQRLQNCAKFSWVAVDSSNMVIGVFTMMPTSFRSDQFTSWDQATGGGTASTIDYTGRDLYVITMMVREEWEGCGVTDILIARALSKAIAAGYHAAYFASRLPDRSKRSNISLDEYLELALEIDGRMAPYDRQLRYYLCEMGAKLVRGLPGGFVGDDESCDDAALLRVEVPLSLAPSSIRRIFSSVVYVATFNRRILRFLVSL